MLRVKSEFGETSIGIYVTPLNTEKEIVIEIRMISLLHIKCAHIFYISYLFSYILLFGLVSGILSLPISSIVSDGTIGSQFIY